MGKLFRIDSPFSQAMSELFDLITLNILFILTCVPVFTIGAALSALHSIGLKQAAGEEPPVVKTYFQEFRKNLKQATIAWIPLLLLGIFLLADYFLAANGGSGGKGMQYAFGVMLLLYLCETHYIFPLIARYENTVCGATGSGNLWKHETVCDLAGCHAGDWLFLNNYFARSDIE